MASYKIIPIRQDSSTDPQSIEDRAADLSALDVETSELRSGILPYTLQTFDHGMCYVEYGREDHVERPILEGGTDTTTVAEKYPLIFLDNGYVAYDANCTADVEDDILGTIADMLGQSIRFEPLEFDEGTLHDVIDRSNKVRGANFNPRSQNRPERVTGLHKAGLQRTDLWEQYVSEPVEMVKVELPDRKIHQNVGFHDDGKITIYGKEIPIHVQVHVLRYITDEVVSNIEIESFQQTLGGRS